MNREQNNSAIWAYVHMRLIEKSLTIQDLLTSTSAVDKNTFFLIIPRGKYDRGEEVIAVVEMDNRSKPTLYRVEIAK